MKNISSSENNNWFSEIMNISVIPAYQVNQVARYIQNIIISILIVSSGISMSDVGMFEIWLFSIAMLSQFWIAGFKDAMVSNYNNLPIERRNDWIYNCVLAHLLAGMACAILFWFFYPFIVKGKEFTESYNIRVTGIMYLVFYAMSQLPENIMLVRNQSKSLVVYTIFSFVLYLILFILYYFFFSDLYFMITGLIVVAMIKSSALFFLLKGTPVIRFEEIKYFIAFSLPFILISVLGYGMEMVDGLMVVYYFDEAAFPVYKYGAREIPLSSLLMNSLSVAMIPFLAAQNKVSDLFLHVKKYMHILFPFSIVLIWISQPAYVFFYNESYSDSALIFNLYLLVIGSRVLLPHSVLLANGHQKWVLISSAFELILNIILSVWWVKIWGLFGLVLATVVAFYFQKFIMLYAMRRYLDLTLADIVPVKWWLFYQLVLFVSLYANYLWFHA